MSVQDGLVSLARKCIVLGEDAPWEWLLKRLRPMIELRFRIQAPRDQQQQLVHFCDWLPGWLIAGQRLEAALRWLEEKIESGDCASEEDQDFALENYLTQVVTSGVGAFFREQYGKASTIRIVQFREGEDENVEQRTHRMNFDEYDLLAEIRQALLRLQPELRVPFWLRYYKALGPLRPKDLAWMAECCGETLEEVKDRIESEMLDHSDATFPISGQFISILTDIPASADGRFLAVDQRISRVRNQLRALLHSLGREEANP